MEDPTETIEIPIDPNGPVTMEVLGRIVDHFNDQLTQLAKVTLQNSKVCERIAWLIGQTWAGDYMSSLDPRMILPEQEIQRRLDNVVQKLHKFIYTGDSSAIQEVAEDMEKERMKSKIIL